MKFLKIFGIVLLCLAMAVVGGYYAFKATYVPTHLQVKNEEPEEVIVIEPEVEEPEEVEVDPEPVDTRTPLEKIVDEKDHHVNILAFGHDGARADTIMVLSMDLESKELTIVSIPRDTYYYSEGYDLPSQDKINAIYGLAGEGGGSVKLKEAVSNLLGVPIDYYVKTSYNGVAAIVNSLGGVSVYVPFDMDYDDEWAEPELHIHIEKGSQTLYGMDAVDYMRWRKNNDGTGDGDIARTKRQRDFVVSALKKAMGLNLPHVIEVTFDYIRTDMTLADAVYIGSEMVNLDTSTMSTYRLPGEVGSKDHYSFVFPDEDGIEELMLDIYSGGEKVEVVSDN